VTCLEDPGGDVTGRADQDVGSVLVDDDRDDQALAARFEPLPVPVGL
jgi:hypothetical protein